MKLEAYNCFGYKSITVKTNSNEPYYTDDVAFSFYIP